MFAFAPDGKVQSYLALPDVIVQVIFWDLAHSIGTPQWPHLSTGDLDHHVQGQLKLRIGVGLHHNGLHNLWNLAGAIQQHKP